MMRFILAVVLIGLDGAFAWWWISTHPAAAAAALPAVVAMVIVGAITQRLLFGQAQGPRARLHPAVLVVALLAFDAVLVGAALLRRA